jgi:drug/metabolite transporter (DMT)-like permease
MPENRLALLLMALSMTLLAAGDALVRLLGESLPSGQIIGMRGVFLTAFLLIGLRLSGRRPIWPELTNRWSLARGLAETFSTYCFFISIQLLPIAVSTTVVFIFPVLLTLVSIPLFGEKVGPYRWVAVLMGFAGVVMISAPRGDTFNIALLLPLGTAFGLVARDLFTRKIPSEINSGTVTLTTAIVTTLMGFASLPFGWVEVTMREVQLLPIAAALVACSFLTYIIAIRRGELSIIAPAQYLVILWATLWGALIWQEMPSSSSMAGGGLIIAAGCLILWRERVAARRQA